MPKSIALFTWGLAEAGGAITNIVAALAKGFAQLGIKEIYIVYLHDDVEQRVELPEEVVLIPLGANKTSLCSLAIARFLRRYQPDIFISLAFLNIPSIVGYLLAGTIKTKLIISQQNSPIYQAEVEHRGNWLFKLQLWLTKYLYPYADGLIATTQPVLNELTKRMGINFENTQIEVIPNPLDIDKIVLQAQEPSSHPWLQQKDTPVIVSVARLAKQKNFPLLLKALKTVRQQLDARLIIFGEGKERASLEQLIEELGLSELVSLPGYCINPYKEMSKADAFILSSEEEAFGLVLVEAMASGTPVVATDAMGEGPKTVLENSEYGLLVPSNDAEALATAITEVLANKELGDRLITKGQERCHQYQQVLIAKEWLFLINLITKSKV